LIWIDIVACDFLLFVSACQIVLTMRLRFFYEPGQVNEDMIGTVILYSGILNAFV